ncbi:MAG: homocysteine S-methyltransferase family protein [Pseudomonadota bacterium]
MQPKYRHALPQMGDKPFLTDGGLETCMIFHEGLEMPLFAAFTLLDSEEGRNAIDRYMVSFAKMAAEQKVGFIMDTPTWRASDRWAKDLGVSTAELKAKHRQAVSYLASLRDGLETAESPFVLNGVIGPQDDGYNPNTFMSADEAQIYHAQQVGWFAELGADMVSAITMTYVEEAIGIAKAAKEAGIPAVISFTVETDGRLPSGQALFHAIAEVDTVTAASPAYFMINCAHPDHFRDILETRNPLASRIKGVRANASRMSHEELDNAEELDDGDPQELSMQYRDLKRLLPKLNVMGGCCGTDHRHIGAICSTAHHG